MTSGPKGVICPILMPFNDDGSIAEDLDSGDRRWLNLRAPLHNATVEQGRALLDALGASADHLRRA